MVKFIAKPLWYVFIVALCVNFMRIIIVGDISNTVSFYTVLEALSEVNADMTWLYKGLNSIGLIFENSVGAWGSLSASLTLSGNFFDKTLAILTCFGRVMYVFVETLYEGSAAVLLIFDGLFAFFVDVFYLLHVIFGFSFTWASGLSI